MTANPIYQYVDLTYLGESEEEAHRFIKQASDLSLAAICISPQFVALAKQLQPHPIASVVNFPAGDSPPNTVAKEINQLLLSGVEEIDIVFPYRDYLLGNHNKAIQTFCACLEVIPKHIVKKVIIETGEIKDQTVIKNLCLSLIKLPINFIKTSTGKTPEGATLESAKTILDCIQGTTIGLKVSGGIRTIKRANKYLSLVQNYFKKSHPTSEQFRIGTSHLSHD
jgi:deoxyribose-phosphate aldolase